MLLEPQPEAWRASAPGGQLAALQAGPGSAQRAAWPGVSDARRARGAHRVHGVRHSGLRAAQDALRGRPAALRAAQVQQLEVSAPLDAASGPLPEASAGLGAGAVLLQERDAPVQPLAVRDVARPAVRRAVRVPRREARAAPGGRLVAVRRPEAQLRAERAVVLLQAVAPSVEPLVRLPQPEAQPARAGSAHRRSMRKMLSLQSASHRTQSSPAGRDEVLS